MTRLAAVTAAALLLCGGVGGASPPASFAHVVVIVFENHDASQITARTAPTFTALGKQYARLTQYYGVSHPSLPNYLALMSGSTHGVHDDCTSCVMSGTTLGDELTRAGRSWGAYAEGYPSSPRFAKKHVPFLYFPADISHVLPLTRFAVSTLPQFALVVPDLCNDMHDCSVSTGDTWLRRFVKPLLALPRTVVFVVFDEGSNTNHVAAFALGTAVRQGAIFKAATDHYGLLRTIEDAWGLARLGKSSTARPITGIFR